MIKIQVNQIKRAINGRTVTRWELTHNPHDDSLAGPDWQFYVQIDRKWNGISWNAITECGVWVDGEQVRLVTDHDHTEQRRSIVEHEGEEAAKHWDCERMADPCYNFVDNYPGASAAFKQMVHQFELIEELGLMRFGVTL